LRDFNPLFFPTIVFKEKIHLTMEVNQTEKKYKFNWGINCLFNRIWDLDTAPQD
jgi:hypothetical protein